MNTISVCMIVKNEERVLERCLKCVFKFADEIIVVDTGSSDRTVDIAKKYTNKIYSFKWLDDFSLARNFSLEKAKMDYVFWIDADDVIDKTDIKKILKLKKSMKSDTYMLKYQIAFDEGGKPTFEYYRERILKNCTKARFVGFVHEVIAPFGKVEYLDIAIKHKKIEKTRDIKRNLRLYQKHLKSGVKLNEREMFYYARELFYNGYHKKCIVAMKKFLKMPKKFLPNVIDAYIMISDCYSILKDTNRAKKYLIESINVMPPNAKICCKLGFLCANENKFDDAIFWFKTALNCEKNTKSGAFVENDYFDFIPFLELSLCYYNLNDYENFAKYHNLAKEIKPYDLAILNNQKFLK